MDLYSDGNVHGGGVGVVAALALVHVVVGVDRLLAAQHTCTHTTRWFHKPCGSLVVTFRILRLPMHQFATVLGSIPASVGTVESEGRQMKQC